MNNHELAVSFRSLAYRDYLAARTLLNNGYPLQGLTLASSSIEKYIKIFLTAKGLTKWDINVHLDNFDKLQKLLVKHHFDFTYKFDKRFLELLGKGYRARYYDNLSQPLTIGFFIGQFLCELDFAVNILEQLMKVTDADGNEIKSPYQRAIVNKDKDLLYNNFIFQNITKKDFMEQPHQGFMIYIDPISGYKEIEGQSKPLRNKYDGSIADINVVFNGQ